ncbi:MAG TPA: AMP-binding protein, partial [Pyrinomonadaceae bacterium]|nr:AMP-binding protein [Pyrinomonadaceae bacterium]
ELRTASPDRQWHEGNADDVALMLLTSGSTGLPKGVMLSHGNILSRSAGIAQFDEFSPADVSFNWFPLDHVGGIVMFHTLAVYLRAKQLLAPTDMILQDPLKWLDVVDQYRVSITWAPNFAFGLVNDNETEIKSRNWDLSSLRFILNGGEAIVAKTSRRFLELLTPHGLPASAMNPAWGMSETSSGITSSHKFRINTTSDEQSFVEVGGPIPGAALRIVDAQDNLVAEDKIGRLQVKGTTITRGYYKNEELNREAFSPDGWFNTGDLGLLHDGCLTITGRTKDVIIINGINFYSHEIEGVVEEVKGVNVSFTAATAVREPAFDTDRLAIFFNAVESRSALELSSEIRAHVLNRIGINPDYIIPVEKDVIPKTAIGKIQRQQLRDRFEAGEFKDQLRQLDIESGNARTIPDWFFQKRWHRREEVVRNGVLIGGTYLVFADQLGLGERLCSQLRQLGNRCVLVEQGSDLLELGPDHYRLNPSVGADFGKLIDSLVQADALPNNIIHLWHYADHTSEVAALQQSGIYSLLETIKALAATSVADYGCRLFVVSSQAQLVKPNEQTEPGKATVLGFLKTLPLELSWLEPRHVDLQLDQPEPNAQRICAELTIPKTRMEIAYREGQRFVAALKQVNLLQHGAQDNPLERGGLYLVTGGLGGVGAELSRFLLSKYDAKLVLIGKTPLPPCDECAQHDQRETELAQRLSNLTELESIPGQVSYEVVDVCDLEGLRLSVARAEQRWGQKLAGVFHLAGGLGGESNLERHWTTMDAH